MSVFLWILYMSVVAFLGQKKMLGTLELEFLGVRNLTFQALQRSSKGSTTEHLSRPAERLGSVVFWLRQSHHFVILFQTFTDKTGTFVDTKHSGSFHVFNYRDEERFLHQTREWTTVRTSSSSVRPSTWPSLDKQIHLYLSTKLADFEKKPHMFTAQILDGFLSLIPIKMTVWALVRLSNLSS